MRGTRQTLLSVWCREGSKGELAAQEAGGRVELQLQHVDLLARVEVFGVYRFSISARSVTIDPTRAVASSSTRIAEPRRISSTW